MRRAVRTLRRIVLAGSTGAAAALAAAIAPAVAGPLSGDWGACLRAFPVYERASDVPDSLLGAVGVAESGRWNRDMKRNIPWPWTVMAEGRGRYLPSKQAAIAEVRGLQRRGIRNIDVGCMQINMYYHAKAFDSLEDAFDPGANVSYAAEFLRALKQQHGSWTRAVGYYHSGTPKFNYPYREKVMGIWRDARHRELADAHAAWEARRQAREEAEAAAAQIPTMTREERTASLRDEVAMRRARAKQVLESRRDRHRDFIERQGKMMDAYRAYMRDRARGYRDAN